MSQSDPIKSQLRIPATLHQRLVDATAQTGRSMNAEILHRLEGSFQAAAVTDGLLRSQLLNFQLSAELLKYNPRMVYAVSELLSGLFDDEVVRERVFALADAGDEIAAKARETAVDKLPSILQDLQEKMASIRDKGDDAVSDS
ncbi:Arc family DNA-binding protein [Stenotrophomonas maltophilia]|uniref:Arc family DNA-binding protein n=1 Tax=Stenotrophomonas maltophilia TaxID=40324 RepID=UPI0021C943C1|nr:Arc family DNA-binding protein [Stenotrophomonas maltophilia]MCU1038649.1 Arc family DNA-binding protein [Stenotrophomonas maltophilia]